MSHFSNTRRLTIEWGHCDPAGIVFNPRYFEFFDWSTGLLVFAKIERSQRVCYYLIGPSVERDSWPAMYRPRCRLFVRI